MTQTRRSGIRLPWSHEDETEDAQMTGEASETSSAEAPAGEQPAAPDGETTTAAQPAVAGSPVASPEPMSEEDNALLTSLITAMRDVAERERSTKVSSLQTAVEEAIERMRARAAEGADQLRARADLDVAGIADWVKSETERIELEGRTKTETRRSQLTDQLAEHEQRSEREMGAVRSRVAEYESQLSTFFAELDAITDPAVFGTAAKRMPRPPALDVPGEKAVPPAAASPAPAAEGPAGEMNGAPAAAEQTGSAAESDGEASEDTASDTAAPAVREATDQPAPTESVEADSDAEASEPAAEPAHVTAAAGEPVTEGAGEHAVDAEASAPESETDTPATETLRDRMDALGIDREGAAFPGDVSPEAASTDGGDEPEAESAMSDASGLAARLAQLDARIGAGGGSEPAGAATASPGPAGGETATAIMVSGLGSFGAITSFKQALERVEGVHGISLSLGPTGEFVYRATHAADFDMAAAIEQIERGTAKVDRQADGALRVTVQRTR